MKKFRRRKSIRMVLALAVVALVLVPLAQARPDMYPGANVAQATPGTIHGVQASLYRRLPADDQAAIAGTGKIGGYSSSAAVAPKPESVSTGSGFSWSSAGIGVGVAAVTLLAIFSVAFVTRRGGVAPA
jgi:hypothetical protein